MGMDLHGPQGYWSCSSSNWRYIMETAQQFGWIPQGTVAPDNFCGTWEGEYSTNGGQWVTDEDARGLGEAILRAIAHRRSLGPKNNPPNWIKYHTRFDLAPLMKPGDLLSGFAAFALQGGFSIE